MERERVPNTNRDRTERVPNTNRDRRERVAAQRHCPAFS